MAIMMKTQTLLEHADGPATGATALTGARLTLIETKDGWAKIKLEAGGAEGWVSADAIDKDATELGSLDREEVAWECVDQGFTVGCNAFYMMTVAQLRSNISGAKLPGTDCIGPFGFSQTEWAANVGKLNDPAGSGTPEMIRWRSQVWVFARMAAERQLAMAAALKRQPTMAELLLGQILGTEAAVSAITTPKTGRATLLELATTKAATSGIDPTNLAGRDQSLLGEDGAACLSTIEAKLEPALDAVRNLVRAEVDQFTKASLALGAALPAGTVKVRLSKALTKLDRQQWADMIASKFAEQGYGAIAQIAAVANAIHESQLNPNAENLNGERSFGLFQLNQKGGVGTGFPEAELKDPARNIEIMLAEIAKPYLKKARTQFRTTTSLFEAVDIFVRSFERPADQTNEVNKRFKTAQSLIA
jgi:hypothetical protein